MNYRILYVEDNRIDFEMVRAILEDQGLVEVIYRVDSKEEFFLTLQRQKIDIIFTDFSLPTLHGLEVIQLAAEKYPDIPVIMITGNLSDEIAVDVIKKGAWDYVLKENIYRLMPAIQSCMDRLKMKKEKDQAILTLSESENNYRLLAESSPYGILVHVKGRVFYHNQKAVKMITGEQEGSFLGLKLANFVHPSFKEELLRRIERIYQGETVDGFNEIRFYNEQGKELILEVASSPITFRGYPAGQVMFRDIAARKKAEMELIQAKQRAEESDRLKTAFLENMSHEVRTPLNGIIGFASLLKQRDVNDDDRINYVSIIEESGKHLLNIINDLIEVSKIETGQFELRKEVFNLNNLLDEIFMFFNESEKYRHKSISLHLNSELDNNHALIYTDKSRLRQVLLNLLNNAYKFTDQGKIEFGYQLAENSRLFRFFVKDSGTGIPEEARDLVFERFRQADNARMRSVGGNGLGLTICRGIVNAMHGKIWLESEPEKGTEFYFEIPFDRGRDDVPDIRKIDSLDSGLDWNGKTILIAEDEQSNFLLLRELLKHTGVGIEHAKTGKEVLRIMNQKEKPDLILMDIKMPELNGLEAVMSLRRNGFDLPVIAQTAFAMSEDEEKCLDAGCNDYITKPIKPGELINKINVFFNSVHD